MVSLYVTIKLLSLVLVVFVAESPAIIADQGTVAARIDQTATLSVYYSTFLGPLTENDFHITWYLPSGQALDPNDTRIEYDTTGSRLILTNVTTDSRGNYTCTVEKRGTSNSARSTSIHLRVFSEFLYNILVCSEVVQ